MSDTSVVAASLTASVFLFDFTCVAVASVEDVSATFSVGVERIAAIEGNGFCPSLSCFAIIEQVRAANVVGC